VASRWFGTIDAVFANQKRDSPGEDPPLVRDRRREDDVERADPVRRDEQQPIVVERVQVADLAGADERSQPTSRRAPTAVGCSASSRAMTVGDVAQEAVSSKQASSCSSVSFRATTGSTASRSRSGDALVGGPQGVALDDRVGLLAGQAAVLDEGHEDAAAGVEAEAPLDVLAHPVGADDEALDERGHPDEHVVEEDRGVRQDDPLGRRVADVALVPQRLVLERGVAYPRRRRARPAIRSDRIGLRLWGIAESPSGRSGTAPVPRRSRCAGGCGPRSRIARASPRDGDRREERGVPVALDDLRAHRVDVQAQGGETSASRSGSRWLYVPTGPEILPVPISSTAARGASARGRARTPSRRA
jgi:hypothetical protein